jgi:hypothetical protein
VKLEARNNERKKGKHIQVFSDGCSDCLNHIDNVEVGKCAGCHLEVHLFDPNSNSENLLISKYGIITHPTTIIDDEIKVEGIPNFYWLCGDEFYDELREKYALENI